MLNFKLKFTSLAGYSGLRSGGHFRKVPEKTKKWEQKGKGRKKEEEMGKERKKRGKEEKIKRRPENRENIRKFHLICEFYIDIFQKTFTTRIWRNYLKINSKISYEWWVPKGF